MYKYNSQTVYWIILFSPYSKEGEVPTAVDACDLKVAHYDFTVLVVLPQGAVLLLQVRQRAQLVLCTSTYYQKGDTDRGIKLC